MENDFLHSLYLEEDAIYNKIIANPLYAELIEVQRFIIRRGGNPKQIFGIKSTASQESLFPNLNTIAEISVNGYNRKWVWEEKTEYGFNHFGGRSTPKDVINLLVTLEGIDSNNQKERVKVAGNVYNVIFKLKKSGSLILDKSIKDKVVYILLIKEEYL